MNKIDKSEEYQRLPPPHRGRQKWKDKLKTTMHLDMLGGQSGHAWNKDKVYGMQWGDPEDKTKFPSSYEIRKSFVDPFINEEHVVLEIGPGGGRWTKYLLGMKQVYVVDYHEEMLSELKKTYNKPNMTFIKNNGTDFPGVPDESVDYLVSIGVFVHLHLDLIDEYLKNMFRIVKPGANIIIQYSNKNVIGGQENRGYSNNSPSKMRELVLKNNYKIISEDLTTLQHRGTCIVCFSK